MNAPRRVALLARRLTILVEHLVDERRDRAQLRLGAFRVMVLGGSALAIARRTTRR